MSQALVDLAVQTGLSVADRSGAACRAAPVALQGRFTVRAALERLLSGGGCTFRFVDTDAVLVYPRPAPSALPGPIPPLPSATPEAPQITVVASRRPEALSRSPYSVSVVDTATLQALGLEDVGGLASLVAGMTTTDLGAGRDKIFLRGLSDGVLTGKTQSTVGVYLDDVLVSYDAPDPDLKLIDLASVEVLRGPQGAIYGSGSIAGVIQYRTRQPDLGAFTAEASASLSATRDGAPGWGVDGVVNLPLVKDRLALRLVGYQETAGGYIDDVAHGRENVNRTDRIGARAVATLALGAGWQVRAGGVFQSLNAADSQYDTGAVPYERSTSLAEPHDNDFSEVYLEVERRLDDLVVKSTTALIHHQLDTRYDATDALPQLAPAASGPAAFDDGSRKRLLSQDITVASSGAGWLQWLAGAYYLRDNETDHSRLADLGQPLAALYSEERSDLQESYALYGEATLRLLPKLYVTGGARLFRTDSQTSASILASDGARRVDVGEHEKGAAPKLVLRYDLAAGTLVYLQASEGYRGGGVNTAGLAGQVFSSGGAGTAPALIYHGDQLWNYEAGMRWTGWRGALQLHGAFFYEDWRRLQSDQLLPSGLAYTANLGTAIDKGVELEAAARPAAGLDLRVNLTFSDPQLTGRTGAGAADEVLLPAISRVSGGAAAIYRFPLAAGLTGEAGLESRYVGRSRISFGTLASTSMGDYAQSRLVVGVSGGRWRIRLTVDNLLDRAADTFAYGNPFSQRLTPQTTLLRPRTAMLKLSAGF